MKSVVSQDSLQGKSSWAGTHPCGAVDNAVDILVNEILAMDEFNLEVRTMANKCEYDAAVDNSDTELLLEATKFDDSNVSHAGSPNQPRTPKRPRGVSDAAGNAMNGIGRGKRRFSTDENYNFYDDDAFQSSPTTVETISEDLNEMKIKIKSRPTPNISKDHRPRNLYNRSSRISEDLNEMKIKIKN